MNVGLAWVGSNVVKVDNPTTIKLMPGDVLIRHARPFKAGVAGMLDSAGWKTIKITPDMVGSEIAQYVALEDKQGLGRTSTEQKTFITAVRNAGGLAGVTRSDEDTMAILRGEVRD